jgi:hypothetical protein
MIEIFEFRGLAMNNIDVTIENFEFRGLAINDIMEIITLIAAVISFLIIAYVIYFCFKINKRDRLEREDTPVKNLESHRLNIRDNEVDGFSLEEDNITIHNKNGFEIRMSRKTKESILYFRGDQVEDVEILGVEDILKFSSEINSGKKVIKQRFWLDDDNLIARVDNNVKDVKVPKSESDSDDNERSGGGADDIMLAAVIYSLLN